jgi:hypothetical protein
MDAEKPNGAVVGASKQASDSGGEFCDHSFDFEVDRVAPSEVFDQDVPLLKHHVEHVEVSMRPVGLECFLDHVPGHAHASDHARSPYSGNSV